MPNTLTGTEAAAAIYAQVRARAARLTEPPCLAAVSVGAQPDDRAYLRSIALSAAGCGVTVRPVPLPADCAPETLTDTLRTLSTDDGVHGVLLLRPLPAALRAQEILDALDARKDVDGMTTWSLGALVTGAAGFAPCTAEACMTLLRAHGIDPAGRRVTVVGRSLVIGRPAALLLTRADATVTLCHRKTPGLAARCREADILLAAAGAPGLITPDCVHPEQIVLDAGVTALPDGTLLGDVAAEAAGTVAACTPVPGGIGSVTTALLLLHTVQSAEIFRQF